MHEAHFQWRQRDAGDRAQGRDHPGCAELPEVSTFSPDRIRGPHDELNARAVALHLRRETVANHRRITLETVDRLADRFRAGGEISQYAAILDVERTAAVAEMIVAEFPRAELEDRGEMPGIDLPAELQAAMIDAMCVQQGARVHLALPQPRDGLAGPIGVELHIRSLKSVPAWPQMSSRWPLWSMRVAADATKSRPDAPARRRAMGVLRPRQTGLLQRRAQVPIAGVRVRIAEIRFGKRATAGRIACRPCARSFRSRAVPERSGMWK